MQTKYTMAVAIAEVAGLSTEGFVRVDDAPAPGSAPRPQFERMSCKRLEKQLEDAKEMPPDGFRTDFKASLAEALLPHLPKKSSVPRCAEALVWRARPAGGEAYCFLLLILLLLLTIA